MLQFLGQVWKAKPRSVSIVVLCFSCSVFFSTVGVADPLTDLPFWRKSVGYWLSQNTYLGDDLNYRIPSYRTATEIKISDSTFESVQTNIYPTGVFQGQYLGVEVDQNRGVEYVQVTKGYVFEGGESIRLITEGRHNDGLTLSTPINSDSAITEVFDPETDALNYRMFLSFPSDNHRNVIVMGINSSAEDQGSLRGLSFFKGERSSKEKVDAQLSAWRKEFDVGTRVYFLDGKYRTEKLP